MRQCYGFRAEGHTVARTTRIVILIGVSYDLGGGYITMTPDVPIVSSIVRDLPAVLSVEAQVLP